MSGVQLLVLTFVTYYVTDATTLLEDLSDTVIENRPDVSFASCKAECDVVAECREVIYHRRYMLCQLLKRNTQDRVPGAMCYTKPSSLSESQLRMCESCDPQNECYIYKRENGGIRNECVVKRCPWPYVDGAIVYGNLITVGSRLKLECTLSKEHVTVTCLGNASWTSHSLACTCNMPPTPGAHSRTTRIWDNFIEVTVECRENLTLVSSSEPVFICDKTTGIWSPPLNDVSMCCDHIYEGEWQKVFRVPHGVRENVLDWWVTEKHDTESVKPRCMYRNITVLSDWNGASEINRAKLNVIKNNDVVAYIIFDARSTNRNDWFTKRRILSSSWNDLNPKAVIETFSATGINVYGSDVWFFIRKSVTQGSCHGDVGWLGVTWAAYPCNDGRTNDADGVRIVYSPGDMAAEMSYGSVGEADRLEVWVD